MKNWTIVINKKRIFGAIKSTKICLFVLICVLIVLCALNLYRNYTNDHIRNYRYEFQIAQTYSDESIVNQEDLTATSVNTIQALLKNEATNQLVNKELKRSKNLEEINLDRYNFEVSTEGKLITIALTGNDKEEVKETMKAVSIVIPKLLEKVIVNVKIVTVQPVVMNNYQNSIDITNTRTIGEKITILVLAFLCLYIALIIAYMLFSKKVFSDEEIVCNTGLLPLGVLNKETEEFFNFNLESILHSQNISKVDWISFESKYKTSTENLLMIIKSKNNFEINIYDYSNKGSLQEFYNTNDVILVINLNDSLRNVLEDVILECKLLNKNIFGFVTIN